MASRDITDSNKAVSKEPKIHSRSEHQRDENTKFYRQEGSGTAAKSDGCVNILAQCLCLYILSRYGNEYEAQSHTSHTSTPLELLKFSSLKFGLGQAVQDGLRKIFGADPHPTTVITASTLYALLLIASCQQYVGRRNIQEYVLTGALFGAFAFLVEIALHDISNRPAACLRWTTCAMTIAQVIALIAPVRGRLHEQKKDASINAQKNSTIDKATIVA